MNVYLVIENIPYERNRNWIVVANDCNEATNLVTKEFDVNNYNLDSYVIPSVLPMSHINKPTILLD